MKILVVGGAGYVGSHCVRLLTKSGHEVKVYDNLAQGHRAAVPRDMLIVGDLHDTARLREVLTDHQIEAVFHFAARALVGESVTRPDIYYRTNVTGTLDLLDSMVAAGVRKMVFSSTCAVFGVVESPITEDDPKNPINPYGFTKLVIERAMSDYAAAFGLEVAVLRYFNACGAAEDASIGEDHDPESHLIPLVLQVALGQRPNIRIFGTDYPTPDGTCVRDYVHVDDLADAHLKVLQRLRPGVMIDYNLGTGVGVSVREVIEAARRVTGKPIEAIEDARRPGDPALLMGNPAKAERELGWKARHRDIEAVIRSAWNWHRTHPNGYADG